MSEEKKPNIADLMANFGDTSGGSDEEMLKIASNYSLQMSGRQIACLMKLKMFALSYGHLNKTLLSDIETFIKEYLELKHFHESGPFIRAVIGDLSLKRIIPNDATKVNVMKGQ